MTLQYQGDSSLYTIEKAKLEGLMKNRPANLAARLIASVLDGTQYKDSVERANQFILHLTRISKESPEILKKTCMTQQISELIADGTLKTDGKEKEVQSILMLAAVSIDLQHNPQNLNRDCLLSAVHNYTPVSFERFSTYEQSKFLHAANPVINQFVNGISSYIALGARTGNIQNLAVSVEALLDMRKRVQGSATEEFLRTLISMEARATSMLTASLINDEISVCGHNIEFGKRLMSLPENQAKQEMISMVIGEDRGDNSQAGKIQISKLVKEQVIAYIRSLDPSTITRLYNEGYKYPISNSESDTIERDDYVYYTTYATNKLRNNGLVNRLGSSAIDVQGETRMIDVWQKKYQSMPASTAEKIESLITQTNAISRNDMQELAIKPMLQRNPQLAVQRMISQVIEDTVQLLNRGDKGEHPAIISNCVKNIESIAKQMFEDGPVGAFALDQVMTNVLPRTMKNLCGGEMELLALAYRKSPKIKGESQFDTYFSRGYNPSKSTSDVLRVMASSGSPYVPINGATFTDPESVDLAVKGLSLILKDKGTDQVITSPWIDHVGAQEINGQQLMAALKNGHMDNLFTIDKFEQHAHGFEKYGKNTCIKMLKKMSEEGGVSEMGAYAMVEGLKTYLKNNKVNELSKPQIQFLIGISSELDNKARENQWNKLWSSISQIEAQLAGEKGVEADKEKLLNMISRKSPNGGNKLLIRSLHSSSDTTI